MKVTITGASGFVGQNLLLYLKDKQWEVNALSLREVSWSENFPQEGDAIIHLAGKAHDTSNTSSTNAYFEINRDLTIELFKCFLKSDIRDFIFFSSVKAVADSVVDELSENIDPNPQTAYGKSKHEAEQYLLKQVLPGHKRLFIIRPCMIHGPGNKGNLNLLYNVVKKGLPWPLASFNNHRSFLSIDNLSFLIEAMLLKKDLESGIYNFSDDDTLSTNELVSLIGQTLGKKEKLWNISPSLIRLIVKLGDVLPLPLNSERLKKLTESYVVSNSKIKIKLEIIKLPISAKEGLIKTFRSFS
ncbi:Nucleoside-diphosphate-sugar epimerase [Sphingobacterium sp. PM2-P1-29]|nr:Nucleoside-diphosphate-sugar epimerase [Sphingobacterium sp. PM2-P1-29]